MSLYDWDGNGKKDFADDFIEFHIFEECMKDEEDNEDDDDEYSDYEPSGESGGIVTKPWFVPLMLLLIIISAIFKNL